MKKSRRILSIQRFSAHNKASGEELTAESVKASMERFIKQSPVSFLSPVIVLSTLQIGNSILIAAELSFLGLGAQPP